MALAILPTCHAQALRITAVQNEATRDSRLSPGCNAIVFVPDEIQQCCSVGGKWAELNYHGSFTGLGNFIGVRIPVELPPGPTTISRSLSSEPVPITLSEFAPGIYSLDGTGAGFGYFRRQPFSSFAPEAHYLPTGLFRLDRNYPDLVIQDTVNRAVPGEVLIAYAVGLGPTDPLISTGTKLDPFSTISSAPLVNPLRLMIDGRQAEVVWAGLFYAGGLVGRMYDVGGLYNVRFRVPADLAEGNHEVALQIGGQTSNSVILPVGKRAPVITGLVNAASFAYEGWSAPGSIMTLYGENIEGPDDLSGFPATTLQGISVIFNGVRAPLFHLIPSHNQINLVTPAELQEDKDCWPDWLDCVTVQLSSPLGVSPRYYLATGAVHPGMFVIGDPWRPARRNVAALFGNTAWRVMPRFQARALNIPDDCAGVAAGALCGRPARPGDVIQIYCTGLGRATPGGDPAGAPLPTGSLAPSDGNPLYMTVKKPEVTIGGLSADVQFSGLTPGLAGLYQVNVRIPQDAPSGDDVTVVMRQTYYSDSATLAIEK